MRICLAFLTSIFVFIFSSCACTGELPTSKIIEKVNRCICKIYIEHELDGITDTSRGSGIILKKSIDESNIYFACTAYHVIANMLKMKNVKTSIYLYDSSGVLCWANIDSKNIIWRDREMDSAIIVLPSTLHYKKAEGEFKTLNPEFIKSITIPSVGEDVYMLGYRWIDEKKATPIHKKGIVSGILNDLPGHIGHYVFLVDKMANKGMSGGLIFSNKGEAIAMISGYLLEPDKKIRTSDDITIGIPMIVLLKQLEAEIEKNSDKIKNIAQKEIQDNSADNILD